MSEEAAHVKLVYMLENPESVIPRRGKVMTIGQSAGKSYAYLTGVLLGDGCASPIGGKLAFRLNTIDEDFALATKAALENVTERRVTIRKEIVKKSSKPNYALYCGDEFLVSRLLERTQVKSCIGRSWLDTDEEKKSLIVGLMDSEGFVAEKTQNKTGRAYYMGFKVCDLWVHEFVELLQEVGIKIGKVSKCPPYREHYKVPTRFHIKMQSWVDSGMRFNIKRKQDRVDLWARTVPYSERSRFPRKLTSETLRQAAKC